MKIISRIILLIIFIACALFLKACAGGGITGDLHTEFTPGDNKTIMPDETITPVLSAEPDPTVSPTYGGADKWIAKIPRPDEVIMNTGEIQKVNAAMQAKCSALTDILSYKTEMSAAEIIMLIEASKGPSLPKFDQNGNEITAQQLNDIKENMNLNVLYEMDPKQCEAVKLKRGVTVQRANIRALPTNVEFYNKKEVQDHDRMQESELSAASAVWLLHASKDGKFYFVQSYYYTGWILSENIAIEENKNSESSDWLKYAELLNMSNKTSQNTQDFIVITDARLTVKGVKIDMGTALPLAEQQNSKDGKNYKVILPGRDEHGRLIRVEADIPKASANIGYLEYTMKNFYIQAFKYVGTPYGWGGMKDGVDCSSYVLSVFKTFGFIFPRNTSQQNSTVGIVTNAENMSTDEKISFLLKQTCPCIIYVPGHVMIYLGEIDNAHYIIHAPGGAFVQENKYDGFESVIRICTL